MSRLAGYLSPPRMHKGLILSTHVLVLGAGAGVPAHLLLTVGVANPHLVSHILDLQACKKRGLSQQVGGGRGQGNEGRRGDGAGAQLAGGGVSGQRLAPAAASWRAFWPMPAIFVRLVVFVGFQKGTG